MKLFILGLGRFDQEKPEMISDPGPADGFFKNHRLGSVPRRKVIAAVDVVLERLTGLHLHGGKIARI